MNFNYRDLTNHFEEVSSMWESSPMHHFEGAGQTKQ